ncbi:MAG: hypothetical protein ACRCX2_31935, partial [Paraclostridium sp.]
VKRYSALTGEGDFMARSVLSQIASPLQAQGKGLSSKSLGSVADVLFGMQYGMGKTRETSISGLMNVLSGKGTLKEAGFAGVKKGASAEATLENILKFLKTNELTKSIMQERSITASMGRVRSAPKSMLADMLDRAPAQMGRSFENMALASEDFFNQEHWGRTMANFELFSKALKDNAGAIGKFGAQVVGLGLKGATSIMDDPKGTLLPAIGAKLSYTLARNLDNIPILNRFVSSVPTLKKWGSGFGGIGASTIGGLFLNSTETGMSADLGNQPGAVDWNSLRKNNSINSMGQPIYIENAYFDENGQLSQDIRHWGGN